MLPPRHPSVSPWYILDGKLKRLAKAFQASLPQRRIAAVNTGTAAALLVPDAQHRLHLHRPTLRREHLLRRPQLPRRVVAWRTTDAEPEAIVDRAKKKALPEYQHLMQRCFAEYYRVLKPGRWMTVVFRNSEQRGLARDPGGDAAGRLRRRRGPRAGQEAGLLPPGQPAPRSSRTWSSRPTSRTAAWSSASPTRRQRRGRLGIRARPTSATAGLQAPGTAKLEMIVEREPRRIYDRMVAWFVRHDYAGAAVERRVPRGLTQRASPSATA